MRTRNLLAILAVMLLATACDSQCACDNGSPDGDTDTDTDADSDSDTDTDADTDSDADTGSDTSSDPECESYDSTEEEFSPIQTTGSGLPPGATALTWSRPALYEYLGAFSGTVGSPASHEGTDYVHGNTSVATVDILAAADGVVEYVRTGCPQSTEFGFNNSLRECGAGWGNHVVIDHGSGIKTRYAHMKPGEVAVLVGNVVSRGDLLGLMGNSGRSDTRHLHFELGSNPTAFDPCDHAQSFEYVYNSEGLTWE